MRKAKTAMKPMKAAKGAAKDKIEWVNVFVPGPFTNIQIINCVMPNAWILKDNLFMKPIRKDLNTIIFVLDDKANAKWAADNP